MKKMKKPGPTDQERWLGYNRERNRLDRAALTPEQYEAEIKRLARKYKL